MAGRRRWEAGCVSPNSRQQAMHEDLLDKGVAEQNLARARAAVKRNRGAAGSDRMTVDELETQGQRHGEKMRAKRLAGRWTPCPVRRVDIPKPNGGEAAGERGWSITGPWDCGGTP